MSSFKWMSLAGVAISLTTSLAFAADRGEPVGYLASARGGVYVDGALAKTGTKLYANSRVKTTNGKAAVLLAGESVIQLTYDSELEIKDVVKKPGQEVKADVNLEHGNIRALVRDKGAPKLIQIRTKTAVMGVRGTELVAGFSPKGGLSVVLVEGKLSVASVAAGGGGGAPPKSVNMTSNQSMGAGGAPTTVSPQESRDAASNVAPPRAETLVVSEVLTSASQGTDAKGGGSGPAAPPSQGTGPKLDPVTNSIITGGSSSGAGTGSAVIVPTSKKL